MLKCVCERQMPAVCVHAARLGRVAKAGDQVRICRLLDQIDDGMGAKVGPDITTARPRCHSSLVERF